MTGERAEKFVVLNVRLLAVTFAVVGLLFIAVPSGVLDVISDVGEWFGNETRAPHTQGNLGGHVQPPSTAWRKWALTRRSSPEW